MIEKIPNNYQYVQNTDGEETQRIRQRKVSGMFDLTLAVAIKHRRFVRVFLSPDTQILKSGQGRKEQLPTGFFIQVEVGGICFVLVIDMKFGFIGFDFEKIET